ncbi:MAG: hypothetical protein NC904_00440 [Candidatus Omnitrophica bacterium]|nr:hypothetical protein [Candidatus Omnitrophota bacterium]
MMRSKICVILFMIYILTFCICVFSKDELKEGELMKKSSDISNEIETYLEEIRQLSLQGRKQPSQPEIISGSERIIQAYLSPHIKDKKIDLEFSDAKLENVLITVAEVAGLNLVIDPLIREQKVDLHLKEVPLEDAFNIIYSAYGLASYQVGNSLFISTKENIRKQTIMTKVIKLENLNAQEAKEMIKDIARTVNIGEETNTLIVMGNPEEISKIESIIAKLDKPQPQVILEAKIIEIDKDALKEIGIDWANSVTLNLQESQRQKALSDPATALETPFKIYRLSRNAIQFDTIIKMLENKNKAHVLSSPRVTTLNNKESTIFVGDLVPYTVTTITSGATTTEVRFADPGIKLKITPSIIENDFVVIKVEPEVSYIYSWRGPNEEYPWMRTRKATANVRVKNNETFIMGGLITKEERENIYRVPFLGNIPILGVLFSYKKDTVIDNELIITVTPTIITGN